MDPMSDDEFRRLRLSMSTDIADKKKLGFSYLRARLPAYTFCGPSLAGRAQMVPACQLKQVPLDMEPSAAPASDLHPNHDTDGLTFPRCISSSSRYILHLFSGQRRSDDLQCALERLLPPGSSGVWVISVDIVHGSSRSDISIPDNANFWFSLIVLGLLIGVISGPPCETWSAARYNPGVHRLSEAVAVSGDFLGCMGGLLIKSALVIS